jgi:hypothetical protein
MATSTPFAAAIGIVVGGWAVVVGLVSKQFYRLKGWSSGDKKAPRWAGRLLFVIVGGCLVLVGLRYFILGY